jgi:hypothetical protein
LLFFLPLFLSFPRRPESSSATWFSIIAETTVPDCIQGVSRILKGILRPLVLFVDAAEAPEYSKVCDGEHLIRPCSSQQEFVHARFPRDSLFPAHVR